MPVDVVMPQMGESIAEGTVTRWMKKVGDRVERDEPMFEISTDKVDAEIPSPAAGTLVEILAQEGQTVAVNSVVARLAAAGEDTAAATPAPQEAAAAAETKPEPKPEAAKPAAPEADAKPQGDGSPSPVKPIAETETKPGNVESLDERRQSKSSPLVRKIAAENKVNIEDVKGSGISGRVTKQDILEHIEKPRPAEQPSQRRESHVALFAPGENVKVEPMSVMRRRISEHMVMSKRTSAHVSTVFEVDFTEVAKLRAAHKQAYAELGVTLTYLPFIIEAVITAIREFPILNSSTDGENISYRQEINIGIAVALDWGLIVPVVRHADEKNILGIARTIKDLGDRARSKKLSPDEVQGGTFTITNPGIFGGLYGLPIINQPQVAILAVGGIKKRPMVLETSAGDSIAIRSMCYLALTFDHRIIDGAVADQFMARIKQIIEAGKFSM